MLQHCKWANKVSWPIYKSCHETEVAYNQVKYQLIILSNHWASRVWWNQPASKHRNRYYRSNRLINTLCRRKAVLWRCVDLMKCINLCGSRRRKLWLISSILDRFEAIIRYRHNCLKRLKLTCRRSHPRRQHYSS